MITEYRRVNSLALRRIEMTLGQVSCCSCCSCGGLGGNSLCLDSLTFKLSCFFVLSFLFSCFLILSFLLSFLLLLSLFGGFFLVLFFLFSGVLLLLLFLFSGFLSFLGGVFVHPFLFSFFSVGVLSPPVYQAVAVLEIFS